MNAAVRMSFFGAILGALLAPCSFAETEPQNDVREPIEQIVVAHKSERRLREIAANVTVLTRDEIRENLSTSLADTFRYAPGIDHEATGTRFGTEGINIRGIGGNRVALLIDGVPLGEQFAIGNFSNATRDFINSGLIQRVEILHGPASALYGSDAIGGVMAVTTPDPVDVSGPDRRGSNVLATWRDADDSLLGTAIAALGDASRGALAAVSLRNGSDVESAALPETLDRKDYRQRSALLKFAAADSRGCSWRGGILHQDSEAATDLRSMLGTGRFAATTALEGDDDNRLDMAHVEFGFGEPDGMIDAGYVRGWLASSSIDQRTLDVRGAAPRPVAIDRRFLFEQRAVGLEVNLQKELRGKAATHRLGAGLEFRTTRTEELRDGRETGVEDGISSDAILGEEFPLRDFPVTDTDKWGAWLEDTVIVGDLSFIAALRADRYQLSPRADRIFTDDNPVIQPVSLTESNLSPKLGIVWRLADSVDAYFQYAHGFRAPPFEDANIGLDIPLFNVRAIPNPDLRSEQSNGFDAGLRWTGEESQFHVGVFHTRYRDFIESRVALGADPDSGRLLFQSRNLSEARIEGIEGAWRTALPGVLQPFSVDGSFYLARGENHDNGRPLNSLGPAQAILGVAWQKADARRQLRLIGTFTERWSKRDETAGALFTPAGHAIYDFLVTQALGESATLRAGIMNLTDRTWWQWSGVRGLAPADPVLPSLAQPGRNLVVSIEWNWR